MTHVSVLLKEFLNAFEGRKIRVFFDGTLGAAGHAEAILHHHPEIEQFIGCDQDHTALELAKQKLSRWKDKVIYIHGNFSDLESYVDKDVCLDGILFDLGVSSMQIDQQERGFSFQKDGPLDMRMNLHAPLSAKEVVNRFSEPLLGEIFRELGEEPRWRQAAKAIVEARRKKKIETTKELCEVIRPVLRKKRDHHPATLVFQALRLYVNDELGSLEKGLLQGMKKLCEKGRIAVMSFHSLEDRIVKNTFKHAEGFVVMTKKPLVAQEEETRKNPRSRSAKLRVAEKKECSYE